MVSRLSDADLSCRTPVRQEGVFGDAEWLTAGPTAFSTVQAVTPFTCVSLPVLPNIASLAENPRFVTAPGQALANKLMDRVRMGASMLHPLKNRLSGYLLQASRSAVFRERLTDTAALMGTSYRHLPRCLSALSAEGLLEKRADGYRLLDRAAPEALVGGD